MDQTKQCQSPEPSYEESLRLGWALLWRAVGSFLMLMFAMNVGLLALLPELTRTTPSLWVTVTPLAVTTVVSALFIMPFVVRTLVRIPFRGFHVTIVRDTQLIHDQ